MKGFTEQWLRENSDRVANDDSKPASADVDGSSQTAKGSTRPGRMNGVEAEYAARLERRDDVAWWSYETFGVRVAKSCFFYPDFLVMRADETLEIHEVKGGYIREDAKVKFRAASEVVPIFVWEMWQKENAGWNRILRLP